MLTDLSRSFSSRQWKFGYGSLFRQQLQKGHHTPQFLRILYDLEHLAEKSLSNVNLALEKCREYLTSMKGESLRKTIGSLVHPIIEAIMFRYLTNEYKQDISDFETKIIKLKDQYRRGDTVLAKSQDVLERLQDILDIDIDIDSIKYIVIDYTLTHNLKLLTNPTGKNIGKAWKQYHSKDRLLLIVNFDPSLKQNKRNLLDTQLQLGMQKKGVPNQENIRFITLDDLVEVFDFDQDTRSEINKLKLEIQGALKGRAGLATLYNSYYKELEYLTKINREYGIGNRLLKNLPF
jgi:hypothetical protein